LSRRRPQVAFLTASNQHGSASDNQETDE